MKSIREPARTIPVMAETDVLVIGGGPGGMSAALAAARTGAETMLVERYGCFGGVITQSMIGTLAWYRSNACTVDAGGIGVEFEQRAKAMGASLSIFLYEVVDTEVFKFIADQMIQAAGIIPVLHCMTVDVIMEGSTIKGVVTESKSGRQAILAKRVIDATGDADIAYRAGVPCLMDPKNKLEEVSVNFGCSGVDIDKFLNYTLSKPSSIADWGEDSGEKESGEFSTFLLEPFKKAREAGEIPDTSTRVQSYWGNFTDAGEVTSLNAIHMPDIDPTDVRDLTKAEIEGRQYVMWAVEALKKYTPGFEKARLRTMGASLGVRESRKIEGAYNITEDDVLHQAKFDDSIGIFPEFLDGNHIAVMPSTGRYFQVPYGIILPQKVENLLVAGRCVAGDKVSHAATRQMMCCTVTGQGAGVAAAVSLKDNVPCSRVNIAEVQKVLKKQGVRIA
ncbi:MAG: FAD-dependent oxidoreductase [Deltaproteobacteria bacterium]|nr:FAD-dependent oxidoreductase [Deltaproteobacteria bacterium]MBW2178268.1 FAD-dependent oxidoreductase [Deltaproteobacteria bacterium]MBW2611552.1 FAD-dependent oxidoreductase [Deltaproteobacteria bacterium]MBW2676671.1 FAD-dependent oxidoreductase [Deltaproteobacteria bacterium]